MKKAILYLGCLVAIVLAGWLVRYEILGAKVVNLSTRPINVAVTKALSQATGGRQFVVGKDYQIQSVKYFDNNRWAVVHVVPVGPVADAGYIVFKLEGGAYQTVLGPANSLLGADVSGLPQSVIDYINLGAVQ